MTAQSLRRYLELPPQARRKLLERRGSEPGSSAADPVPVGWPRRFPASRGQEALWFLWRLAPKNPVYNVPSYHDLSGPLSIPALATAVRALVARHEMLRTTFAETDTGVVQIVHEQMPVPVELEEAPDREAALAAAAAAGDEPFDLRTGPLLRLRVWRYGPQSFLLLVVAHHIAVDERSSRVIERDLGLYYEAPPLEPPAAHAGFGEFALRQREQDWTPQLRYWGEMLAGSRPTELPPDHSRPDAVSLAGRTVEMELTAVERAALTRLTKNLKASRFTVLSAIFGLFLSAVTGEPDVCFGTPMTCRDRETEEVVGFFLNPVVLRLRIGAEDGVADLIGQAQRVVTGALRHREVPFQAVAKALSGPGDASRNPVFDVMFLYLTSDEGTERRWPGKDIAADSVLLSHSTAHTYVAAGVVEHRDRAVLVFRYPSEVFDESTVHGWGRAIGSLLTHAAEPGLTVAQAILAAGVRS